MHDRYFLCRVILESYLEPFRGILLVLGPKSNSRSPQFGNTTDENHPVPLVVAYAKRFTDKCSNCGEVNGIAIKISQELNRFCSPGGRDASASASFNGKLVLAGGSKREERDF